MPRLQTLKSRIQPLETRKLQTVESPGKTKRARGRSWMVRRYAWLAKHPECAECGLIDVTNQVDHIVPLWEGGADDESNMQTLCSGPHGCHTRKSAEEAKRRARVRGGVT